MTHRRDREYWGKLVEEKLNLSENRYLQKNTRHQAAKLQTCNIEKNYILPRKMWGECYCYYR